MEIDENTSKEECSRLYKLACEYGERSMNSKDIRKAWKKGDYVIIKRVNTPEKIPVVYIYLKNEKVPSHMYTWFSFVCLKGKEGTTFVCSLKETCKLIVIKSHLVSRYMERHGWDGDRESCEDHILLHSVLLWYDIDKSTGEVCSYFDDGLFLGSFGDGTLTLRTYVDKSSLYQNQKVRAKWQELKLKDARRMLENLYDPVFAGIVRKLDNIKTNSQ